MIETSECTNLYFLPLNGLISFFERTERPIKTDQIWKSRTNKYSLSDSYLGESVLIDFVILEADTSTKPRLIASIMKIPDSVESPSIIPSVEVDLPVPQIVSSFYICLSNVFERQPHGVILFAVLSEMKLKKENCMLNLCSIGTQGCIQMISCRSFLLDRSPLREFCGVSPRVENSFQTQTVWQEGRSGSAVFCVTVNGGDGNHGFWVHVYHNKQFSPVGRRQGLVQGWEGAKRAEGRFRWTREGLVLLPPGETLGIMGGYSGERKSLYLCCEKSDEEEDEEKEEIRRLRAAGVEQRRRYTIQRIFIQE